MDLMGIVDGVADPVLGCRGWFYGSVRGQRWSRSRRRCLFSGVWIRRRCQGGPNNAGLIGHLCCHYRGIKVQQGEKFVGFATDATAENNQVRPKIEFDIAQIFIDVFRPAFPGQLSPFPYTRCSAFFGIFATDFDVPEFRVGHKAPVDKQCRANASAQRCHEYDPRTIFPSPKTHLRAARSIGVVEDYHRTARRLREQL